MKLLFEKSVPGKRLFLLPACDVTKTSLPAELCRAKKPRLPELTEVELSRHYSALEKRVYGVNDGFYPLGSCTMKYNPAVNEEAAALPGFTGIHPLQPESTVQGSLEALWETERILCRVTGMEQMTFQPAAGAHGEFTGLLLIKAYHDHRGDQNRKEIIVPDSAHGTNPASAAMCGFTVVNIPSGADGCVDLSALKAAVGPQTAGLMLTNPNTLGIFDKNILDITRIIHEAGGLCYYDGANLNAVMGVVRPGDMGFDVIHLNLHKSFSTPHGGGGPGACGVGVKAVLAPYLPKGKALRTADGFTLSDGEKSVGRVRAFYGNFLVTVRALCYLYTLGGNGIREVAENAVLNANYLKTLLNSVCPAATQGFCMHEFVLSLEELKKRTGVSALDLAKGMIDMGMHPPTMYFPLIIHEALMFEPTETESKETLDMAAERVKALFALAQTEPERLHSAPHIAPIGRPDEVRAARSPVLRYGYTKED